MHDWLTIVSFRLGIGSWNVLIEFWEKQFMSLNRLLENWEGIESWDPLEKRLLDCEDEKTLLDCEEGPEVRHDRSLLTSRVLFIPGLGFSIHCENMSVELLLGSWNQIKLRKIKYQTSITSMNRDSSFLISWAIERELTRKRNLFSKWRRETWKKKDFDWYLHAT